MLAPQSDEEIRPVVEALRRLDPLLDVRWEPRAFRAKSVFDVRGVAPDAKWEGRWEVIRFKTPGLHAEREYVRICMVTELRKEGKVPVMLDKGAYAPLGLWLVEYMQLWDRAQNHFAAAMDELWREHDAVDAINDADDRAANQQGLEKIYREHAGQYWMGRGAAFSDGAKRPSLITSP